MAFTHYKTKGICLKKQERGEADYLLTIFTKDFGRIEVLAKGVRKIASKLKYGTEIFCLIEIEFIQGKGYKTLTDVIVIDRFKSIKSVPEKFNITKKIANIVNALCLKEGKDDRVWQLLIETFWKLEIENSLKIGNWKLKIIQHYFLWNLFSILGYAPELYNCSICQKRLVPKNLHFCSEQGGVICFQCYQGNKEFELLSKIISVEVVKILRLFIVRDWDFIKRIKIDKETTKKLSEISNFYLLQG